MTAGWHVAAEKGHNFHFFAHWFACCKMKAFPPFPLGFYQNFDCSKHLTGENTCRGLIMGHLKSGLTKRSEWPDIWFTSINRYLCSISIYCIKSSFILGKYIFVLFYSLQSIFHPVDIVQILKISFLCKGRYLYLIWQLRNLSLDYFLRTLGWYLTGVMSRVLIFWLLEPGFASPNELTMKLQ